MLSTARRVVLAGGLVLAALASIATGSAAAGEYGVSVCRHADGSVAPTDGWQITVADDFAVNDRATNSCSLGGAIDLELGEGTAHGRLSGSSYTSAAISFAATPPPATSWRAAEVWWAYRSSPAGPSGGSEQITGSIAGAPAATCAWASVANPCSSRGSFSGPPLSAVNRSLVPITAAQATDPLAVTVSCSSAPSACPSIGGEDPYAQLRVWRLRVTLTDSSAPAFGAQPAMPSAARDALPLSISASDTGGGVHSAQLVVDGAAVGSPQVIDAADGRCVRRFDGSFGYLVPCPLSLAAAPLTLATTSIPNGTHAVSVMIADAAGNTAVSEPRNISVENSVALSAIPLENPLRGKGHVHNGSGSAARGTLTAGLRRGSKGRLHTSMRVRPGRRIRLAGRLVGPDGKPIVGALLSVSTTRAGAAPGRFLVRTRTDGAYSRNVRWGPSRRVIVKWYPFGDSTQPVSSRSLRLLGVARVTLRVDPRRPRNGGALVFAGRVVRAPAAARVTIQVRVGRLWRTFLVPAVNGRGHYRARRTLTRSAGLRYCLRARVLARRDFAYSAGSSRSVCRRVR